MDSMAKKGDFVKIEYTGYDENGNVFDSTRGEIAKQLHGKEGALLIVLGVDYMVKGLEDAIISMKKGEEKEIALAPENAFGTRDRRRLKIFPISEFYRNKLDPSPGSVIQMETEYGVLNGLVKSVNSGRVLVDFNHPLAEQNVKYRLKLAETIEDGNGKMRELMKDLSIEGSFFLEDGKATITMKKGQQEDELKKTRLTIAIKSTIPEVKNVEFRWIENTNGT